MPRKPEVDKHPKKKQIIRALIRGVSYRDIMGQFGVTKSALGRYLKERLPEKAAKALAARDVEDGNFILDEIQRIMARVNKMFDACDEYLSDPEEPGKYDIGPRADEVTVNYYICDTEGKNVSRFKDTLQNIINQLRGVNVTATEYKYADPRKLLLETARTLHPQLELLVQIHGQIKDVTVNIINSPEFISIQNILLEELAPHPEARLKIAERLSSIDSASDSKGV